MNLKYDFVSGQVIDIVEGIPNRLRHPFKNTFSDAIHQVVPGGIFIIKRENWVSVTGMRTKFNTGEESDLGLRLIKKGFNFVRKHEIISKQNTYPKLDIKGLWKQIFNKAAFYPICVIYRDHFANRYMYYRIWKSDKTFILLIISIVLISIYPPTIPVVIIYFLAILLRSIKQVKNFSVFQYMFYFLIFDLLNIIFLFIFFPKNKQLEYEEF